MRLLPKFVGLAVTALTLGASSLARAEVPVALPDFGNVIESGYAWFQARAGAVKTDRLVAPVADRPTVDPNAPILNPPIRLSLVARDWGKAYAITGRTTVSDELRLSRSSRMMVGRARLDLGRLQPFAHVALGEWRYDPTLMTLLPANQEYASQLALGFEYRVAKYARIGLEADYTLLVRERRDPENHPTPSVLGVFAVMHARF